MLIHFFNSSDRQGHELLADCFLRNRSNNKPPIKVPYNVLLHGLEVMAQLPLAQPTS